MRFSGPEWGKSGDDRVLLHPGAMMGQQAGKQRVAQSTLQCSSGMRPTTTFLQIAFGPCVLYILADTFGPCVHATAHYWMNARVAQLKEQQGHQSVFE